MTGAGAAEFAAQLRQLLAARYEVFATAQRRVTESPAAGPVHKTRVAARSLRSVLVTLRPVLDARLFARARRDLRDTAVELEDLRSADVRRRWLAAVAADSAALAPGSFRALLLELERAQQAERRRLHDHLQSAACSERAARLAATFANPSLVRDQEETGDIVLRRLRHRWKRLRKALARRRLDPGSLHEKRLAVKHARYASEALLPLFGIDARRSLAGLRRLQDCLGEHRDATEALAWLDGLGEPPGPLLGHRLAGPIAGLQKRRLRELARLTRKLRMPELPRPARRPLSPARRPRAGRSARS